MPSFEISEDEIKDGIKRLRMELEQEMQECDRLYPEISPETLLIQMY
jgi:hypothetical protein